MTRWVIIQSFGHHSPDNDVELSYVDGSYERACGVAEEIEHNMASTIVVNEAKLREALETTRVDPDTPICNECGQAIKGKPTEWTLESGEVENLCKDCADNLQVKNDAES